MFLIKKCFQMTITSDVQFSVITGCMLALKGILVNFTQDEQEAPEQAQEIYLYVKKACELHDLNRRVFQRGMKKTCTITLNNSFESVHNVLDYKSSKICEKCISYELYNLILSRRKLFKLTSFSCAP